MKKLILAFFLLTLTLSLKAKEEHKFKLIHVKELDTMITEKTPKLAIFDANTKAIRAKEGVIPGAKPLSSSNAFNVSELPAEKDAKLVFYCANTKCTASHNAADRAIENGYTDVTVFADGIFGWKSAGKPTSKL